MYRPVFGGNGRKVLKMYSYRVGMLRPFVHTMRNALGIVHLGRGEKKKLKLEHNHTCMTYMAAFSLITLDLFHNIYFIVYRLNSTHTN